MQNIELVGRDDIIAKRLERKLRMRRTLWICSYLSQCGVYFGIAHRADDCVRLLEHLLEKHGSADT